MKKKILILVVFLFSLFVLVGCGKTIEGPAGPAGANGQNGANGKSAFEIAKEKDPTLTSEEDWLESLQGTDGRPGATGPAGTNGTNGKDAKEIELFEDDGGIYWRYVGSSENQLLYYYRDYITVTYVNRVYYTVEDVKADFLKDMEAALNVPFEYIHQQVVDAKTAADAAVVTAQAAVTAAEAAQAEAEAIAAANQSDAYDAYKASEKDAAAQVAYLNAVKAEFLADINAVYEGETVTAENIYATFNQDAAADQLLGTDGTAGAGLFAAHPELLSKWGWVFEFLGEVLKADSVNDPKHSSHKYEFTALRDNGLKTPADASFTTGSWKYCNRYMLGALHNFLNTANVQVGGESYRQPDFSSLANYDVAAIFAAQATASDAEGVLAAAEAAVTAAQAVVTEKQAAAEEAAEDLEEADAALAEAKKNNKFKDDFSDAYEKLYKYLFNNEAKTVAKMAEDGHASGILYNGTVTELGTKWKWLIGWLLDAYLATGEAVSHAKFFTEAYSLVEPAYDNPNAKLTSELDYRDRLVMSALHNYFINILHNNYKQTADLAVQEGKTYYHVVNEEYVALEEPVLFVKTTDTEINNAKAYFVYDEENEAYKAVTEKNADDLGSYYEQNSDKVYELVKYENKSGAGTAYYWENIFPEDPTAYRSLEEVARNDVYTFLGYVDLDRTGINSWKKYELVDMEDIEDYNAYLIASDQEPMYDPETQLVRGWLDASDNKVEAMPSNHSITLYLNVVKKVVVDLEFNGGYYLNDVAAYMKVDQDALKAAYATAHSTTPEALTWGDFDHNDLGAFYEANIATDEDLDAFFTEAVAKGDMGYGIKGDSSHDAQYNPTAAGDGVGDTPWANYYVIGSFMANTQIRAGHTKWHGLNPAEPAVLQAYYDNVLSKKLAAESVEAMPQKLEGVIVDNGLPEIKKDGYAFLGWADKEDETHALVAEEDMVDGHTYVAQYLDPAVAAQAEALMAAFLADVNTALGTSYTADTLYSTFRPGVDNFTEADVNKFFMGVINNEGTLAKFGVMVGHEDVIEKHAYIFEYISQLLMDEKWIGKSRHKYEQTVMSLFGIDVPEGARVVTSGSEANKYFNRCMVVQLVNLMNHTYVATGEDGYDAIDFSDPQLWCFGLLEYKAAYDAAHPAAQPAE